MWENVTKIGLLLVLQTFVVYLVHIRALAPLLDPLKVRMLPCEPPATHVLLEQLLT